MTNRRVAVSVTDAHIESGIRGHAARGALALALRDAGFRAPLVFPASIEATVIVLDGQQVDVSKLPRKVIDFDCDFEEGKPVKPFTFVLRIAAVRQTAVRLKVQKIKLINTPKARERVRDWLLKQCDTARNTRNDLLQNWYFD